MASGRLQVLAGRPYFRCPSDGERMSEKICNYVMSLGRNVQLAAQL